MALCDKAISAIKAAGLPVYRPGEKVGTCKESYIVVYDGGEIPITRVNGYRIVGVAAFAPIGRREEIEPMLKAADTALAGLRLRPRGSPAAEGIDDKYKAHTQSIEYMALCAL